MDPTESTKNLTFSPSVPDAAPILKADVLANRKTNWKKRERAGRKRERKCYIRSVYSAKTILLYTFDWTNSKFRKVFSLKSRMWKGDGRVKNRNFTMHVLKSLLSSNLSLTVSNTVYLSRIWELPLSQPQELCNFKTFWVKGSAFMLHTVINFFYSYLVTTFK